jgi:hypothetical protein
MASCFDGGRLGCSQVRALAGRLSARGVLLCRLRPSTGRGWVVLFRILGPFPELSGAVQIGYLPAGLAGEFTAALSEGRGVGWPFGRPADGRTEMASSTLRYGGSMGRALGGPWSDPAFPGSPLPLAPRSPDGHLAEPPPVRLPSGPRSVGLAAEGRAVRSARCGSTARRAAVPSARRGLGGPALCSLPPGRGSVLPARLSGGWLRLARPLPERASVQPRADAPSFRAALPRASSSFGASSLRAGICPTHRDAGSVRWFLPPGGALSDACEAAFTRRWWTGSHSVRPSWRDPAPSGQGRADASPVSRRTQWRGPLLENLCVSVRRARSARVAFLRALCSRVALGRWRAPPGLVVRTGCQRVSGLQLVGRRAVDSASSGPGVRRGST